VALGAELREVVVKKFAWDGLCKKILTPLVSHGPQPSFDQRWWRS
jgi:hypothetical protein